MLDTTIVAMLRASPLLLKAVLLPLMRATDLQTRQPRGAGCGHVDRLLQPKHDAQAVGREATGPAHSNWTRCPGEAEHMRVLHERVCERWTGVCERTEIENEESDQLTP